ncbi:MAG: ABC transporter ATP-binding protein [Promethearchaeota archaeon]
MKTPQKNILEVKHISKSYGDVHAVADLSFEIRPGEIFGLLGPNGAGKTTTVKGILGLISLDRGNIDVLGLDPNEDEIALKQQIGYVSEEPLIYKSLTPRELFNFIASIRKLDGEKVTSMLSEYLDALNTVEYYDRLISTLSRGNKQKIQIIAALLHSPKLLILDEPLAGLDAKSVKVIKEILDIHTERGGSALFSTHIMEVAEELCDRIGIINEGSLVAIGTMDDLRQRAVMEDKQYDLEDIFLQLTNQNDSVQNIITKLRAAAQ